MPLRPNCSAVRATTSLVADAEYGALNPETVQANIVATAASDTLPIICVPDSSEAYIR